MPENKNPSGNSLLRSSGVGISVVVGAWSLVQIILYLNPFLAMGLWWVALLAPIAIALVGIISFGMT